ncbi:MAG: T9SS type A sorting domain-containing protein, partial [Ignavibacteriota bacterium]
MKSFQRIFFFLLLLSLISQVRRLDAQWVNIAANRLTPYSGTGADVKYGAIHYHSGTLWAGWTDLWFSKDLGQTWQRSPINLTTDDIITDIQFYDDLTGIITTAKEVGFPSNGLLRTTDGGLSWKKILSAAHCVQAAFNGSANNIHVLTVGDFPAPTGFLYTTIDGGTTWSQSWPGGDFSECFTIAKDGTIYLLSCSDPGNGLPGFISASKDLGKTWQQRSAEIDGDSYSISADSCDTQRLYVANEDYEATFNQQSELFYSPDAGNTWVSSLDFPTTYFSGSVTCTKNAIYASSLRNGIYRSSDNGVSWKNIGGPNSTGVDTRNIACVDDNMVFAVDADGSIWKTTNSGGDPLSGMAFSDLVLSKNALFTSDSILICDTSISGFIHLKPIGCTPLTIVKLQISGPDSLSYAPIPIAGDSIGVKFLPLFDSLNSAQLIITLSDGSQKIVTLSGFAAARIPLTLQTQNQVADTLGGEVVIPITLSGLRKPEDITLVLHYDTVLNYIGSFSASGTQLDIPNEQWKGRSKLRINSVTPNSTVGFAHFDVFNDSVSVQHVSIDSVTVISASNVCQYLSPATVTSTIVPLSGCGVGTVSQFLHYGRTPELKIIPNPSGGITSIVSSADLGDVQIIVYDELGKERATISTKLSQNSPVTISAPAENGIYMLRIHSI